MTAAENFLSGFINEYVNVKNDQESIEKRMQSLESYMVKQEDNHFEDEERFNVDGLKGDRELKDQVAQKKQCDGVFYLFVSW